MSATGSDLWRPAHFASLPVFSLHQVKGLNFLRQICRVQPGWEAWIREGLQDLLETPAGQSVRLERRHTLESEEADVLFTSDAEELYLGRSESCEIRLTPRTVGTRHAHIFFRDGKCHIEDLGSSLGTFVNDTKLAANHPVVISTGDRFAIFPYTFTVQITQRWVREAQVEIVAGAVRNGQECRRRLPEPVDRLRLAIRLEPWGVPLVLELPNVFVKSLCGQLLASLHRDGPLNFPIESLQPELMELLLTAVLERANRDLKFPLQASLRVGEPPLAEHATMSDAAITFSFVIRIGESVGALRLFVPNEALESLCGTAPGRVEDTLPGITWRFPISAGWAALNSAELATIEVGDVVLLQRQASLLFPNWPERGWRLRLSTDNFSEGLVDKEFGTDCLRSYETPHKADTMPDFADLPVHLHAIIGEKELTLAEASLLSTGAIVPLESAKSDPVRIALNGKILGLGELVEIEGQLGIRIVNWMTP